METEQLESNPVIGYYKICHIAPKGERRSPEFFFYRSGEQALACSAALAVAKGRSVDTPWVVSNYDPSNRCHPALAVVE